MTTKEEKNLDLIASIQQQSNKTEETPVKKNNI